MRQAIVEMCGCGIRAHRQGPIEDLCRLGKSLAFDEHDAQVQPGIECLGISLNCLFQFSGGFVKTARGQELDSQVVPGHDKVRI